MPQNIEIKAYAFDFERQIAIAESLSGTEPVVIHQEDIFFHAPTARLKLRIFSSTCAELIFYQRSDESGPALSNYVISKTNDPKGIKTILATAYGIKNTVIKTRYLFMHERTRIHFDVVESLGHFIELEVVLSESEELDAAQKEADKLMQLLEIQSSQLVDVAYVDLLDQQING